MKNYLIIYYAPAEAMSGMATATDEEKQAGMAEWFKWKDMVGEENIQDFGAPLMPGQKTIDGGSWKPGNSEVTGYSLIQGESMDTVKKLCESHPHLHWHEKASIEVFEKIKM